jgi:hypothetical protein
MSHKASTLNSLDSIFGDGATGSATISTNTTFLDSAYTNLTINNNGVGMYVYAGRIFVKGTLTIETQNVTLRAEGSIGGNATNGNAGGAGGTPGGIVLIYPMYPGSQGEGGSLLNGAVCNSPSPGGCQKEFCFGGKGGKGGNGGYGRYVDEFFTGGTAVANITLQRPIVPLHPDIMFDRLMSTDYWYAGQGGGGGGPGGGGAYVDVGYCNGAGGGAGGCGGSMIVMFIKKLVLNTNLRLSAIGGEGGAGSYGTPYSGDGNGAGAPGGGGGGGCVILVVGERSGSGTLTVDISGGNSSGGYAAGGIGGISTHGYGGSRGSLWYVNLATGTHTYYAASDVAQSGTTGEAGVYVL